MNPRLLRSWSLLLAVAIVPACGNSIFAPADPLTQALLKWNAISIDASGADHMPSGAKQQIGPCRASRSLAIVHIAMFDAANAATSSPFQSYAGVATLPGALPEAAVAQAAHDALVSQFSHQTATFDAALATDLAAIPDGSAKTLGIVLGTTAAAAIVALRNPVTDGSWPASPTVGVDYIPGGGPGEWRIDPITQKEVALGGYWALVSPFTMTSASQFRAPAPPALGSPQYASAYNEVLKVGGDGITTPTIRTADQTDIGIFWAYDGVPSLCAPPRLYNQITTHLALQRGTTGMDLARLLALVNTAMADAGIACWESKYFYKFWRPVAGIREADAGTTTNPGATSPCIGDGNAATVADPTYTPLGAPASNIVAGQNFTPPFPAYPSGHAAFGGALFETLRRFYGTDAIRFTFVSDELNGVTVDGAGRVRPLRARSFESLSQAEDENGQSRIYLGIHWAFDKTAGIAEGNRVGDWCFDHSFLPSP
jgi:hypothetical protein